MTPSTGSPWSTRGGFPGYQGLTAGLSLRCGYEDGDNRPGSACSTPALRDLDPAKVGREASRKRCAAGRQDYDT
jgi:hypothetical protein